MKLLHISGIYLSKMCVCANGHMAPNNLLDILMSRKNCFDILLYFEIWPCENYFYGIGHFPCTWRRWHFGSNWWGQVIAPFPEGQSILSKEDMFSSAQTSATSSLCWLVGWSRTNSFLSQKISSMLLANGDLPRLDFKCCPAFLSVNKKSESFILIKLNKSSWPMLEILTQM